MHQFTVSMLAELPAKLSAKINEANDYSMEVEDVASRVVSSLQKSEIVSLAHAAVVQEILRARRERARSTERAASSDRSPGKPSRLRCTSTGNTDLAANAMTAAVAVFQANIRLTVTDELLESTFALGDSTSVTWREASVDQHELRAALLVRSASGTVETAARHRAAAQMLRDTGAPCLGALNQKVT